MERDMYHRIHTGDTYGCSRRYFIWTMSFHWLLLSLLSVCVYVTLAAKLDIQVQHRPAECKEQAENGDTVSVHYTGTLKDGGKEFDSSRRPGRDPINFQLGKGMVIKGWEQGIQGMCIGEKRKLTIPHELAYGKDGRPPVIPGSAALIFETELVSILTKGPGSGAPPPQAQEQPYNLNIDGILMILKFVSIPVILGFLLYHLYRKYKQSPTKKELKEERKRQMKKKR